MYEKKQRIQIYQLMKLGITSTVTGAGDYNLQCYHHVRIF